MIGMTLICMSHILYIHIDNIIKFCYRYSYMYIHDSGSCDLPQISCSVLQVAAVHSQDICPYRAHAALSVHCNYYNVHISV